MVTATNAVGTGPPSASSNAATPDRLAHPGVRAADQRTATAKTSLAVTPTSAVTAANRLVVEVGAWNSAGPTATAVTDSAGDPFVELTHFTASDKTEMSVWSAPITAGGGTKPTITAKVSSAADIGVTALEYSGLSTVADASVVDQSAHATGTTGSAQAVSSGSTPATTLANELAIGLYVDSGFNDTLTAGPGYTARTNVSPTGDIELLAEDTIVGQGANPAASVNTGKTTIWLMTTLVLKHT